MTRARRPGSSRLADVGVVGLLVVALAACVVALRGPEPARATEARAVAAPVEAPSPVTSLWFGDSIVEGCCRSSARAPSMVTVAAQRLGWQEPQKAAVGGTGYLKPRVRGGVRYGPYPERIAAAVEGSYYDVVVVSGGNNDADADFDAERFRAAVRSVLGDVRTALPEAQLVVLGPYSPTGRGYVTQRRIEFEETQRAGGLFVDQVARGWMRDRPDLLAPDGFHPNDAGQAHLGVQLATVLRQDLPPALTAPRRAPAA